MLTKKQQASLLTLYEKEICKMLEIIYLDPRKGDGLAELLPLNEIRLLCDSSENRIEFGVKLFKELRESSLAPSRLYHEIMRFLALADKDSAIHTLLAFTNENARRSKFSIVLENLDDFLKFTNPNTVLNYLEAYPRYFEIVRILKEEIGRIEDDDLIKKLVLRTIPQLGQMSVYDVMLPIYKKSSQNVEAEARAFIDRIVVDFLKFYERLEDDKKRPRGRIIVCPISQSVTDLLMVIETGAINENPRYTIVDLAWERLPHRKHLDRILVHSIENRVHMQNPIVLREYQKELCKIALDGENTIVTAPTGSGKTIIAANILKNHFEKARDERRCPRAKALFMTPNTVILKQQESSISSYLEHLYATQIIQGSDNIPIRESIASNDLIISTPQMIVNLCSEHLDFQQDPEFRVDEFFLSTFSIIIFDECHGTHKNSPYSNVMKIYHKLKNMRIMPEGHQLPQIIGLTASLGVGAAKDRSGACSHIADLCANMDVKKLSVVHENLTELQGFSPIVPDGVCYCEKGLDEASTQFISKLSEMMKDVETKMINTIDLDAREAARYNYSFQGDLKKPPDDKEHQGYLGWVSNALRSVSEAKFNDDRKKRIVVESLEYLKKCHLAIGLSNDFNSNIGLEFMRDYIAEQLSVLSQEMQQIWEEYQHQLIANVNTQNEMITQVEEHLIEQHRQNADFRAIVFIRTRYGALMLRNLLNGSERLKLLGINAEYISGLNKSGDDLSASKREQQDKIVKFAKGDIRVLVATSVAEEGLDIAKCNLVIKYNYATNEIAHVQRRGRGRAANSKCVLITNDKSLQKQEENNRNKEILMKDALEWILYRSTDFEKEVEEKLGEIWKGIMNDEMKRELDVKRQINSNIMYTIICSKCDTKLCTHRDIRSMKTQYFVCDPNIWKLIRVMPLSAEESERDAKFHGKGKIKCLGRNCGKQLGRIIEVKTIDLPCLSADAITLEFFENNKENRKSVRKWKDIIAKYFSPSELRALDLKHMQVGRGRETNFEVMNPNGEVINVIRH